MSACPTSARILLATYLLLTTRYLLLATCYLLLTTTYYSPQDMADCALETVEEMGWGDNQLLPVEGPASVAATPSAARFKGPREAEGAEVGAKSKTSDLDHLDGATPLATPWLASSPLASAARGLGKVCWSETSFSAREVEIDYDPNSQPQHPTPTPTQPFTRTLISTPRLHPSPFTSTFHLCPQCPSASASASP